MRLAALDTDLLVAAHGPALANMVYLPAEAVVLEFLPYLVDDPQYGHLARHRGLRGYLAWHAPSARFSTPADEAAPEPCLAHWIAAAPEQADRTVCRATPACASCMRDHQNVVVDLEAAVVLVRRALDLLPGTRDERIDPVYDLESDAP